MRPVTSLWNRVCVQSSSYPTLKIAQIEVATTCTTKCTTCKIGQKFNKNHKYILIVKAKLKINISWRHFKSCNKLQRKKILEKKAKCTSVAWQYLDDFVTDYRINLLAPVSSMVIQYYNYMETIQAFSHKQNTI